MAINELTDDIRRGGDKVHVWFNVLVGYMIALSIPSERTWWNDSIFGVVRMIPHSQAVWGGSLAVCVTVYTVGSFMRQGRPHRGAIVITGALLCFTWYFTFCMCLARQTYVEPKTASSLWPLLCLFVAVLYAHRAILYLNIFTGRRWSMDPFQMYAITFLMFLSISEVVIGVSPQSVQAQFDKTTAVSIAGANFVGACVVMFGLHLKDLETGLWVELWGYAALTFTMLLYIMAELGSQGKIQMPIATLGFALSEAFVAASMHRAIQIAAYKWSLRRGAVVSAKLTTALSNQRDIRREGLLMGDPTSIPAVSVVEEEPGDG